MLNCSGETRSPYGVGAEVSGYMVIDEHASIGSQGNVRAVFRNQQGIPIAAFVMRTTIAPGD